MSFALLPAWAPGILAGSESPSAAARVSSVGSGRPASAQRKCGKQAGARQGRRLHAPASAAAATSRTAAYGCSDALSSTVASACAANALLYFVTV